MRLASVLRKGLKKGLEKAGFDVLAINSRANFRRQRMRLLTKHHVDLILDVGAADGGYARDMRKLGYQGQFRCFEPLQVSFDKLTLWAEEDNRITVYKRALSDHDGEQLLHIAGNLDSSSLREMLPAHFEAAPQTHPSGTEMVTISRLDSLFDECCNGFHRPFLKIDTQGAEMDVLKGAGDRLSQIVGLQVELSLVPLYNGQKLWTEVIEFLGKHGFTLCSLEPGFTDSRTGRLLQIDGVFYRI
jgi:FkbM family methyltransferase